MADGSFPDLITSLPEADVPFAGISAWILQGQDHQAVFFDIEPAGDLPSHSHGEQWGTVIEGEMELTIGGRTQRYGKGDSYHIPAGVTHGARFLSHFRAIDVFADADRYKAMAQ